MQNNVVNGARLEVENERKSLFQRILKENNMANTTPSTPKKTDAQIIAELKNTIEGLRNQLTKTIESGRTTMLFAVASGFVFGSILSYALTSYF